MFSLKNESGKFEGKENNAKIQQNRRKNFTKKKEKELQLDF